jgi:Fe-Mn family superoxide dismutase
MLRTVIPVCKTLSKSTPYRCFSSGKYELPGLDYDYAELEPYISAEIMEIHHSKHHNTYITNLNMFSEKLEDAVAKKDVSSIVSLQQAIKFNGGGHLNHSIFWKNLIPANKGGGDLPVGELRTMIEGQYGSLEKFQTTMAASTVAVQGSGWGWLGYDKVNGKLSVTTTFNQDPLQATTGLVPLLGIDVWEHAYYLQYKNVRPDYVKSIWNIINWKDVTERLEAAKM